MNNQLLSFTTLSKRFFLLVCVGVLFFGFQVSATPVVYNVTGTYYDENQNYELKDDLYGYMTFETSLSPDQEEQWQALVESNFPPGMGLIYDMVSCVINYGSNSYIGHEGRLIYEFSFDQSTNKLAYNAVVLEVGRNVFETQEVFYTDNIITPISPRIGHAIRYFAPDMPNVLRLNFEELHSVPESSIALFLVSGFIIIALMVPMSKRHRRE